MPAFIQRNIQAAEQAASRPLVRVLVCAYLLAAVWLTPATDSAGQLIQIALATILIAAVMVDMATACWRKNRRFLAVIAVLFAGAFWWITVGGWII